MEDKGGNDVTDPESIVTALVAERKNCSSTSSAEARDSSKEMSSNEELSETMSTIILARTSNSINFLSSPGGRGATKEIASHAEVSDCRCMGDSTRTTDHCYRNYPPEAKDASKANVSDEASEAVSGIEVIETSECYSIPPPEAKGSTKAIGSHQEVSETKCKLDATQTSENVHLTSSPAGKDAAKSISSDEEVSQTMSTIILSRTSNSIHFLSSPGGRGATKEIASDVELSDCRCMGDSTRTNDHCYRNYPPEAKVASKAIASDEASEAVSGIEVIETSKCYSIPPPEAKGSTKAIGSQQEVSETKCKLDATETSENVNLTSSPAGKDAAKSISSDEKVSENMHGMEAAVPNESGYLSSSPRAESATKTSSSDEETSEILSKIKAIEGSENGKEIGAPFPTRTSPSHYTFHYKCSHFFCYECTMTESTRCLPTKEISVMFCKECDTRATILLQKDTEDDVECIKYFMSMTSAIQNLLHGGFIVQVFNTVGYCLGYWESSTVFTEEYPSTMCLQIPCSELFADTNVGRLGNDEHEKEDLVMKITSTITGCCEPCLTMIKTCAET